MNLPIFLWQLIYTKILPSLCSQVLTQLHCGSPMGIKASHQAGKFQIHESYLDPINT
jgi:hypothetical protein